MSCLWCNSTDYCLHISNSFDNLARVYSHFHEAEYQTESKSLQISLTHLLIMLLQTMLQYISWNESLNELNCHLHPLDSIAKETRAALKTCEQNIVWKVWGRDCIAENIDIVLAMNKLLFKNGKGDPRGFATFLYNEQFPRGIIPQYRGNHLYILFDICGIYVQYHSVLTQLGLCMVDCVQAFWQIFNYRNCLS